jgi:3-dehydroquinate dehydratase-2
MSRILILNGPNMNLLGKYNLSKTKSLSDILNCVGRVEKDVNIELFSKQFNSEEKIIDIIHQNTFDYIIGNLSSYQRTSIAIRDAILSVGVKFVEVQMTNLYFKNHIKSLDELYSCFSDIAEKRFTGVDEKPYVDAFKYVLEDINKNDNK